MHTYADGSEMPQIIVRLTNSTGTHIAGQTSITVDDVPPVIPISGEDNARVGAEYQLELQQVIDPGDDTITSFTVVWGDGSSDTFNRAPVDGETVAHTFLAASASNVIRVTLVNEDGTFEDAGTKEITITEIMPPVADANGPYVINEGDSLTLDASGSSDPDGDPSTASSTLTINNVAPMITQLASDGTLADKALPGDVVSLNGTFNDAGIPDTHTAEVSWGDGSAVESLSVVDLGGTGTFAGSHTYNTGGIFTITVTVTDDDGGQTTDTTTAVVTGVGLNGGVLQVVGSDGNDRVVVSPRLDMIQLRARLDGQPWERI